MNSYIPIRSTPGRDQSEIYLLHPGQLRDSYGFVGPFTIVKTQISVDPDDEWWISLIDDGMQSTLISSNNEQIDNSVGIDLTALLGHGITVMPWRRITFNTNGYSALCDVYFPVLLNCTRN